MSHDLLYFVDAEAFVIKSIKLIQGDTLIKPDDLHWPPSNLMRIPNTD